MLVDITTFTVIRVVLSLVGIFAGLAVAGGFAAGKELAGWTGLFLATTVLTNVSGFFFPFVTFLPSHGVGIVSLLLLPVVLAARYWKRLDGGWRTVFVAGSVTVLYLNAFVLVVQSFRRFPALIASAPTQKEPPFVVTQLLVLGDLPLDGPGGAPRLSRGAGRHAGPGRQSDSICLLRGDTSYADGHHARRDRDLL